ncbi:hypothetical protein [Arthrobacter sp. ISL-65]|uniref:hypothetical protein n=1 Tax=Arthrobacter sp. ISL-65 TaxID=2819112 RepID=UPI001BEC23B2|nr:hypothetical protein [Arthrobacter sp. ISL-65]MBT2548055.1 hypothetical protein [Arthrobacter sp. ISL-65]
MRIKDHWNRLSPSTRQWFIDNPGCVIVPRTLRAAVTAETGEDSGVDAHGETVLSEDDQLFIRSMTREEAPTADRPDSLH